VNLRPSHASLVLSFLLAASFPCRADILLVNAGGTGQYPTIQAAVDAAVDGDEVQLMAGIYSGNGNFNINFLGKAITLRSQNLDPSEVMVSPTDYLPETDRAVIFNHNEGSESIVEAVTISGWGIAGITEPSIVLCDNSSPTIRNCIFANNQGNCISVNGSPLIEGCTFAHNSALQSSGLGVDGGGPSMIVRDCQFFDNHCEDFAGGAWISSGLISQCSFWDNGVGQSAGSLSLGADATAEDCTIGGFAVNLGGAVTASGGATLRRCTISGRADRGAALAIFSSSDFPPVTVEHCFLSGSGTHRGDVIEVNSGHLALSNSIVGFCTDVDPCDHCGPIWAADANSVSIACTDIYGNSTGDWVGPIADFLGQDGNISADPLFCESVTGIYSDSPCAPANSGGCGLIGRYGVACEPSSVEAKSWARIKAMYR
jgi:hypothetical protein